MDSKEQIISNQSDFLIWQGIRHWGWL